MSQITRRELIAALSALGLSPSAFARDRGGDRPAYDDKQTFAHGVASGDPLHDRVILWTRVTPRRFTDDIEGKWRIATDEGMKRVCNAGRFSTDVSRDFTVKIDADGLDPGRTYFYQFDVRGAASPIGRTRTLPIRRVDRFRMAFASCSNYPYGYFNAYARIAARDDLDLVVHLGDYIYEYAMGGYDNPALVGLRDVVPVNEIVTLTDYRLRHALYKSDRDLQEAHRRHPFVCVWDDHESANDAYDGGAENHNPELGEGEWTVRRRQAVRAYNEYMPIRSSSRFDDDIFRRFRIGDLADLIMLDTRLHGRDLQAAFKTGQADVPFDDLIVSDSSRSLLGFDQERWLERQLWESKQRGAAWRVMGQQVMMAQLSRSSGRTIVNPDQWDGYRPARTRLFEHLTEHGIRENVVLTGDIHSAWCADLTMNPWDPAVYDPSTGTGTLGVEFICPAVTSPGATTDANVAAGLASRLRAVSPHLKYIDLYRRGYGVLDLTKERAQGEIYHVDTVEARSDSEQLSAVFVSETGSNALVSG